MFHRTCWRSKSSARDKGVVERAKNKDEFNFNTRKRTMQSCRVVAGDSDRPMHCMFVRLYGQVTPAGHSGGFTPCSSNFQFLSKLYTDLDPAAAPNTVNTVARMNIIVERGWGRGWTGFAAPSKPDVYHQIVHLCSSRQCFTPPFTRNRRVYLVACIPV